MRGTEVTFAERMTALGLRLPPDEAAKLETMVAEMEAAADALRTERPYSQEPLAGFRLQPAPLATDRR